MKKFIIIHEIGYSLSEEFKKPIKKRIRVIS